MLALDHTCSTNVPLVLLFFLVMCCHCVVLYADYAACMLWNLKLRRWEVGGFPVSWILRYPRFVKLQHCIGGWLFSRSVLCPNSGDGDLSVRYSADGCTKTNSMESSSFPSFSIEVSNLSQLLPKWLVLSAFFKGFCVVFVTMPWDDSCQGYQASQYLLLRFRWWSAAWLMRSARRGDSKRREDCKFRDFREAMRGPWFSWWCSWWFSWWCNVMSPGHQSNTWGFVLGVLAEMRRPNSMNPNLSDFTKQRSIVESIVHNTIKHMFWCVLFSCSEQFLVLRF